MKKKEARYSLDELIEIIENDEGEIPSDFLSSIVYAIRELKEALETLDNDYRGYDP